MVEFLLLIGGVALVVVCGVFPVCSRGADVLQARAPWYRTLCEPPSPALPLGPLWCDDRADLEPRRPALDAAAFDHPSAQPAHLATVVDLATRRRYARPHA